MDEWFISIGDQERGPFSFAEGRRHYKAILKDFRARGYSVATQVRLSESKFFHENERAAIVRKNGDTQTILLNKRHTPLEIESPAATEDPLAEPLVAIAPSARFKTQPYE